MSRVGAKSARRAAPRGLRAPALTPAFEEFRDRTWRREDSLRLEHVSEAERFVERLGFAACLTDSRRPGPSLYIAVCGRRDAVMPRNVQKDPEASLAWTLKDDVLRRGRVYYAKLARGKATFIAPRLIPAFRAIWGLSRADEATRLSTHARAVLKVLRREWEMASADLRTDAGIEDRAVFSKALDELQAAMLVLPSDVVYQPKFTYIWSLAAGQFPDAQRVRMKRADAVRELARAFLRGAGMTLPGELARVTGLSRAEAGLGNRALVEEGFATSPARGVYVLTDPNAEVEVERGGAWSEDEALEDAED